MLRNAQPAVGKAGVERRKAAARAVEKAARLGRASPVERAAVNPRGWTVTTITKAVPLLNDIEEIRVMGFP